MIWGATNKNSLAGGGRKRAILSLLLLSAAAPHSAFAAEIAEDSADATIDASAAVDAAHSANADASFDGQEIIVSARRRDESAQDVPIALTVVGASALESSGSYHLGQIQQLVPSLQVFSFNPRNTNVNIRGLGSNVALTNDGLENGVGFYIDNVYYGRVGASQFDLVDLAQIEVLRGPQGTLFGKNTTAGAINISSRLPSFEPEFRGEASVGDYGYYQLRASASTGLVDDLLAVRLSGAITERRGFLYNETTNRRAQDYYNWNVRGQLLFTPSEDVSVRIIGDFSRQKQNFALNILANYFGTYDDGTPLPNSFEAIAARFPDYTFPTIAPFKRRGQSNSPYQANMDGYGVSGQVDWTIGTHQLTSITAYRWWDWNPANDGDATALSFVTKNQISNRQRQFSQELRLASDGEGVFNYVLGAYYYWQTVRGYGKNAYGDAAALWELPNQNQLSANLALNGFESNYYSEPTTKTFALFGQGDYKLSDSLTFTAGLRWTHEKKEGVFDQFWVAGPSLDGLTPVERATVIAIRNAFHPERSYETSFTDNSLSGLATLSWKVGRDALLYASYSRGNKSGGLNLTNLPSGVNPDVRPEKVDAYEVGLKSQWLDRRLTLNLSAYWTDVKDYQAAVIDQLGNANARQYIANIPSVRSRGVDADLIFAPTDWLQFTASGAYADARYRDYKNAPQKPELANLGGLQDLSGERLAGVPKFTYSLGADASAPLGQLGGKAVRLYGHGEYAHRSSFNTSASNSRFAVVDAYGIANGRIGVRTEDGFFDLSVWVKNLFDKNYFQTLSPGKYGFVTSLIGEPRTWGLTARTAL